MTNNELIPATPPVERPDYTDLAWQKRARFRAACRRSLFYFVKACVCATHSPNLMTERTFRESVDWLQYVVECHRRGMFEDPRNHTKSHRATIGIPMWIAISRPDDAYDFPQEIVRAKEYLVQHPHIRGVDTRIGIASEAVESAAKWVSAIKTMVEQNAVFQWAFPELIWLNFNKTDYGCWTGSELFFPGVTTIQRDGFVRALGIRSKSSGGRVDILLVDDLVSEESSESTTELAYRRTWFRSIMQLTEVPDRTMPDASVVIYVNNRWNFDDPNSMVHDELLDWSIWSRAAWVCGEHGYGNCGRKRSDAEPGEILCTPTSTPLWPERHSNLDVIRQQFGDLIFFTQWGNSPQHKSELDASAYVEFHTTPRLAPRADDSTRSTRTLCIVVPERRDSDSHTVIAPERVIPLHDLQHHCLSIDPASADETSEARKRGKNAAWGVTWQAYDQPTDNDYILDAVSEHWTPDEGIERIYALWVEICRILQRRIPFVIEKVAAQTFVATAIMIRARADGITLIKDRDLILIPPVRGPRKWGRISATVGNKLGQHKLHLRAGLLAVRIETRHAPQGTLDLLDAIAQALSYFQSKFTTGARNPAALRARQQRRKARRYNASVIGA